MAVYQIDPLTDERWSKFLENNPEASIFHTSGWLKALRQTYGYEPIVYTSSRPGSDLENGVPFCRVNSRLTGRRLVSVPFSDHCQPLVDCSDRLNESLDSVIGECKSAKLKYAELRPLTQCSDGFHCQAGAFGPGKHYYFHKIDLNKDLDALYANLHKTAIKQMIRRAEREELEVVVGTDDRCLRAFYDMLVMTRRRHCVPPQPIAWFRNVLDCLDGAAVVRVALKDGVPTASIITVRHKSTAYYKYGCSDPRFTSLGGTQLLLWHAIKESVEQGASYFDMGRTDCDNHGLAEFKERWGAQRSEISYYRYPVPLPLNAHEGGRLGFAKNLFGRMPDGLLVKIGEMMYRHVG